MTALHPDLEALMPEPTYIYHASCIEGEDDLFEVAVSGRVDCESCTLLFTADQVRAAILGAAQKERKELQAALRHAGLMLVRTEHGLCVMKAITDAKAGICVASTGGGHD